MKNPTCSFCSNPPVCLDLFVGKTFYYCQDHRPKDKALVAPTKEGRISYIDGIARARDKYQLCFVCGTPSTAIYDILGTITRYLCEQHLEKKPELHIWRGEVDSIIAESAEEAAKIARDQFGYLPGEGGAADDFQIMGDDEPYTFIREPYNAPDLKEIKPARDWIVEFGKGYFASNEW